jgi:hypothetical protein
MSLSAYNKRGWKVAYAREKGLIASDRAYAQTARYGKINYTVYRSRTKGKPGYCAIAKGSGIRRASAGYRRRNEGHGCGLTARAAIMRAVGSYFTKRVRKVRRK